MSDNTEQVPTIEEVLDNFGEAMIEINRQIEAGSQDFEEKLLAATKSAIAEHERICASERANGAMALKDQLALSNRLDDAAIDIVSEELNDYQRKLQTLMEKSYE